MDVPSAEAPAFAGMTFGKARNDVEKNGNEVQESAVITFRKARNRNDG